MMKELTGPPGSGVKMLEREKIELIIDHDLCAKGHVSHIQSIELQKMWALGNL